MFWHFPNRSSPDEDDFTGAPPQGPLFQWGLGVVAALVIAGLGVRAIVEGSFTAGKGFMLLGTNAALMGTAWIAVGVFLHCHYFWGNVRGEMWGAVLGKLLSAATFIGAIAVVMVRLFVLQRTQ